MGTDGTGRKFKRAPEKVFGRSGEGGHSKEVQAVQAIGPDMVASAARDRLVKVFSIATGLCLYDLTGAYRTCSLVTHACAADCTDMRSCPLNHHLPTLFSAAQGTATG